MPILATKACRVCGEVKPLIGGYYYIRNRTRYESTCKTCLIARRYKYAINGYMCKRGAGRGFRGRGDRKPPKSVPAHKVCTACSEDKPISEFSPKGVRFNARCKACRAAAKRANVLGNKAAQNRRNARKKGAGGSYTAADIRIKLRDQKGRCWWCHEKLGELYHIDHVYPIAKGGSSDPGNIAISCPACNNRKHAKTPLEFAGRLF